MSDLDSITQSYASKTDDYFHHSRRDQILPLLPAKCARILEIGCGAGTTLAHLKDTGVCDWVGGVELFPSAAAEAAGVLDFVRQGNIETLELDIEPKSLDVVLCLDVLEHLVDPWATVRKLTLLLKPGGMLIASLPNVRHIRVILPLLIRGEWNYGAFGLLDRTHLRFFTRSTATALLETGGLRVDRVLPIGLEWTPMKRLVRATTFGKLDDLLTFQYLLRAAAPQQPRGLVSTNVSARETPT
jgi:2-polyprenyl-3-methyl-5-hydroxy-6-metoxy-1,4-benzoquinol methylase